MDKDSISEYEEGLYASGGGLDAVLDQAAAGAVDSGSQTVMRGRIIARARAVIASTEHEGDFVANGIWGVDLARMLSAGGPAQRPFLLDVRSRAAYARGHIPGARHAELRDCLSEESLSRLPSDRKIVVVCDFGNHGPQAVAALRLLGYDAAVLRTGINGWARSALTDKVLADISSIYPVEHMPPKPSAAAQPAEFTTPDLETYDALAGRLRLLFATPAEGDFAGNVVHPAALQRLIAGADGGGGPFILDVRREEDFEGVGHIAGAMHVDFNAALEPANLARVPRGRKIVTVCYTGNLAAQLVTMLRLLDYDAAALQYGMVGWKLTPTTFSYKKDLQRAENPVEPEEA